MYIDIGIRLVWMDLAWACLDVDFTGFCNYNSTHECVTHNNPVKSRVSFTCDANRENKALNITNVACYISQRENTDHVVTFSTTLPDFRIALMRGSKEYFTSVCYFSNHRTPNPVHFIWSTQTRFLKRSGTIACS